MKKKVLSLDCCGSNAMEFNALNYADNGEVDIEQTRMKNTLVSILRSNFLTDRQREALKLRYVDRLNVQEVAAELGITPPTASKHLKKARARVASVMLLSFPRLRTEYGNYQCEKSAQRLEKNLEFTFYGLTTEGA